MHVAEFHQVRLKSIQFHGKPSLDALPWDSPQCVDAAPLSHLFFPSYAVVDYLLVFVRARLAEPGQIKDCYEILERNISIININAHDALGQVTTDILR
jgi:hypothetical protein